MKKSMLAFATFAAMAGSATAQSSVTLFGIVDAAARTVKNGSAGSQKQLASGSLNTSRFGLRGVEDLGDGLRAAFHLEAGVSTDLGTTDAAKFFGRRSTVSLIGRFGELRLGRDYNPSFWNTAADPFGLVGVASTGIFTYGGGSNLGSPATTTLRNDNSIGYFLPSGLGGFYGQAMVAMAEGTVGNKYSGFRVGYAQGPIDVGLGYGTTDTGSTPDFKQTNFMVTYELGFMRLAALYDVKKWSPREQKVIMLGATVPLGVGQFRLSVVNANRSGGPAGSGFANADDSRLVGVGYVHNLSKRSALYTSYGRITNKGAARSSVLFAAPAGMLGGQASSGLEFGVSHRF